VDVQDYRLGVDFGTSNTVAVLGRPDGSVRSLLFDGSPTLPSAVFHDPTAGVLVGRDAAHAARFAPECYEPNPKRRIDEHTVLLGEAEVPVVDLIAAVLSRVATEARRVAGGPPSAVTLTCPAAWAQTRRGILVAAADRAGLPHVTLVPEPVAAASNFLAVAGGAVPVGSSVLVYDLGAGTFDASVVRQVDGGFEVVAAEGLSQAGGLDLDAAIVGYLGAVYSARSSELWNRLIRPTAVAERRANRLLWEDVRTGKEMLSRAPSTMIHVPVVNEDAPLGRPQFEQLARPLLDSTIAATRAALNAAGVAPADVAGVFLVGGGSRIPLVATLLHQAFGRAPTVTEQPELVVALGCLQATGAPLAMATIAASPPPVSAPPTQPVSAAAGSSPASSAPASSAPASSAPPLSAAPWSTGPVDSAAAPPMATPGPEAPGPQSGRWPPRQQRRPRARAKVLVATGLAVVLPIAVVAFVLIKFVLPADNHGSGDGASPSAGGSTSASGSTSGQAGAPDPRVHVNRVLYHDDSNTLTLTGLEVQPAGKLKVNFRWDNTSSGEWSLSCSSHEEDLRSSYLTLADGRQVYPEATWCTSHEDGHTELVQPGHSLDVWGVFASVPERGSRFALNWYSFVRVNDLTL
jgi:actin-like ATPase involved in cell morphogenesis